MDDDFGGASTFDGLFEFLHNWYFPRIAWSKVTLSPKKSRFFTDEIKVLGWTKDGQGLRPSSDKLAAIRDYPSPTNEAELKRFLYMLPFIRTVIGGRSDLDQIMRSAIQGEVETYTDADGKRRKRRTKKDTFQWTAACEEAFQQVKKSAATTILHGGVPELQYHLACDASATGIGGYLVQLPNHSPGTLLTTVPPSEHNIVMFLSFPLADTETRYLNTERECLAVVRCLAEVAWLVLGGPYPVKVYTDHMALLSILQRSEAKGRIANWQYKLSEFDLEFVHVPGKQMAVADGLSRITTGWRRPQGEDEDDEFSWLAAPVEAETVNDLGVWNVWLNDPWYGDMVHYLLTGSLPEGVPHAKRQSIKRQAHRFILFDNDEPGLGYRELDGRIARCLTEAQIPSALDELHDIHGHYSYQPTYKGCLGRYYWPLRTTDISKYCMTCPNCQFSGNLRKHTKLTLVTFQPMDIYALDFLGPVSPVSGNGNKYLLVGVDYATRKVNAKPMPTNDAQQVKDFLTSDVARHMGWPRMLYTDNGSHFTAQLIDELCKEKRIKQFVAPPYSPWSVGLAESVVKLIREQIRKYVQFNPDWINHWDFLVENWIIMTINSRPMPEFHNFSPMQLYAGYQPRFFGELASLDDEARIQTIERELPNNILEHLNDDSQAEVRAALTEERRMTTAADRADRAAARQALENSKEREYKVGDLVVLRRAKLDKIHTKKLETKWLGPYYVRKVIYHKKSYQLEDLPTGQGIGIHHADHLKLWQSRGDSKELEHAIQSQHNREYWETGQDERRHIGRRPVYGPFSSDMPAAPSSTPPPPEYSHGAAPIDEFMRSYIHFDDEHIDDDETSDEYWRNKELSLWDAIPVSDRVNDDMVPHQILDYEQGQRSYDWEQQVPL